MIIARKNSLDDLEMEIWHQATIDAYRKFNKDESEPFYDPLELANFESYRWFRAYQMLRDEYIKEIE